MLSKLINVKLNRLINTNLLGAGRKMLTLQHPDIWKALQKFPIIIILIAGIQSHWWWGEGVGELTELMAH